MGMSRKYECLFWKQDVQISSTYIISKHAYDLALQWEGEEVGRSQELT